MAAKKIKAKNLQKNQIVNVGGALLKIKSISRDKKNRVLAVSFQETNMKQMYDNEEEVTILA